MTYSNIENAPSNVLIENSNDWFRGGEAGWLYPPQYRVCFGSDSKFHVIDETGWDGYKRIEPQWIGSFNSYQEAVDGGRLLIINC